MSQHYERNQKKNYISALEQWQKTGNN